MMEYEYTIFIEGSPVTTCYGLEYAMIIAKAIFEEYYAESNLSIEIRRQVKS